MSLLPDSRVVTERGLVRVSDVHLGELVLARDGSFHKLLVNPIPRYVEEPVVRLDGCGVTFNTKILQGNGELMEAARMTPNMSRVTCVTQEEWDLAVEATPRAEMRPRGMVVAYGSRHLVLGLLPVAILGRVLFASAANTVQSVTTTLAEYRGHVWDLCVEGCNVYVAERLVVEGKQWQS